MNPNDVAIRKRNQIAKANRAMFLWIAIASALVGAAVVVSIFFAQQLMYNEKVLAEQAKTVDVLKHNNSVAEDLQNEIRVIDTNVDLSKVKANDTDQALQVILDALPSDANSLALGASLQNKLLTGIPGLQPIQTLQVTPVAGIEASEDAGAAADEGVEAIENSITFNFAVVGTEQALQQVLDNLERSIRTIEITSLRIENQADGTLLMTVNARAFYEPEVQLELKDKAVPR
jgi:hypothetical protein